VDGIFFQGGGAQLGGLWMRPEIARWRSPDDIIPSALRLRIMGALNAVPAKRGGGGPPPPHPPPPPPHPGAEFASVKKKTHRAKTDGNSRRPISKPLVEGRPSVAVEKGRLWARRPQNTVTARAGPGARGFRPPLSRRWKEIIAGFGAARA